MIVESNSANYLISLPVTYVDELEGFDEAEVEIGRWLVQLRAREEPSCARRMLFAFVELPQSRSLVLGHLFEVVWVLEHIEVIDDVELLVAHLEYVEECRACLVILQLDHLNQVRILSALPHFDRSISEGDQNNANWVLEGETDAGHSDDVVLVHE